MKRDIRTIDDKTLIQVGEIIDNETSLFLREVAKNRKYAFGLFDHPHAIAEELNMKISPNVADRVKKLKAISGRIDVMDYVNDEMIEYFNKVTLDGRFIKEMATDPEGVAKKMHLSLSKKTAENIKKIGFDRLIEIERARGDIGTKADWVVDAVIVIVIVTTLRVAEEYPDESISRPVIDYSGLLKL